jgi:hypothetical protein
MACRSLPSADSGHGSSLNLHVHFHTLVLDGVFVAEPTARCASILFQHPPTTTCGAWWRAYDDGSRVSGSQLARGLTA